MAPSRGEDVYLVCGSGPRTPWRPQRSGNSRVAGQSVAAADIEHPEGAVIPENPAAEHMVRTQLESRDVHDARVKLVMARLPRHLFVPGGSEVESYSDHPLVIGHGQTISQPYIVAVMTQELGLRGGERVLEIGTGSGYQTAVLAALGAEVFTVERIGALLERARVVLDSLGLRNVHYLHGDGGTGWPEYAPFDRILVTAAPPAVPEALSAQLGDNGILVAPIGEVDGYQRLVTVRRIGASLETSYGIGCRFVPLVRTSES